MNESTNPIIMFNRPNLVYTNVFPPSFEEKNVEQDIRDHINSQGTHFFNNCK